MTFDVRSSDGEPAAGQNGQPRAERRRIGHLWAAPMMIAALLPPAAILHLILTRAVNVPYLDEWALVPFILKADGGAVTIADLWARHNEHHILAIRAILMVLLPFTHFNVVDQMLVAFGLAIAALLVFWRALAVTVGRVRPSLIPALTVIVSLLVFSTAQYETWLFSLPALQWQLSTFCAAVTVWAIARRQSDWSAFAVAASCSAVSALSIASGIALMPAAGLGIMLRGPATRRRFGTLAIGTFLVSALLAAPYAVDYAAGSASSSVAIGSRSVINLLAFVAAYFGAPLALHGGLRIATVMGCMILAVGAVSLVRTVAAPLAQRANGAPWVALWMYAFGVGAITSLGRACLAPDAALARRYPAAAVLLWVATLVMIAVGWAAASERLAEWGRTVVRAAALVLMAGGAFCYLGAYRYARYEATVHEEEIAFARLALLQYGTAPYLYRPDPDVVRSHALLLKQAGLGPYYRPH